MIGIYKKGTLDSQYVRLAAITDETRRKTKELLGHVEDQLLTFYSKQPDSIKVIETISTQFKPYDLDTQQVYHINADNIEKYLLLFTHLGVNIPKNVEKYSYLCKTILHFDYNPNEISSTEYVQHIKDIENVNAMSVVNYQLENKINHTIILPKIPNLENTEKVGGKSGLLSNAKCRYWTKVLLDRESGEVKKNWERTKPNES